MRFASRLALFSAAVLTLAACGTDDAFEAPTEELTTSEAVADVMLQRYNANVGSVDGFTVRAGGAEARYAVSDDTSGLATFQIEVGPAGDAPVDPAAAQLLYNHVANVPLLARGLRSALFGGAATRDGRRAYVLSTDNPASLFGEAGQRVPVESGQEFRIYVDAETFDVIEIFQSFVADSLAAPVTTRIVYSDFREVGGLTLPYQVREVTTGLEDQLSDEEKMLAGGQLGIARSRTLETMPAGPERDAQIAEIDAQTRLLTEGVLERTLTVDEIVVGAPEGMGESEQ